MYVCICKGITEKQLRDAVAVRKGQNAKEVMKTLGVGSDCGTCLEDAVQTMLDSQGHPPRQAHDTLSHK